MWRRAYSYRGLVPCESRTHGTRCLSGTPAPQAFLCRQACVVHTPLLSAHLASDSRNTTVLVVNCLLIVLSKYQFSEWMNGDWRSKEGSERLAFPGPCGLLLLLTHCWDSCQCSKPSPARSTGSALASQATRCSFVYHPAATWELSSTWPELVFPHVIRMNVFINFLHIVKKIQKDSSQT